MCIVKKFSGYCFFLFESLDNYCIEIVFIRRKMLNEFWRNVIDIVIDVLEMNLVDIYNGIFLVGDCVIELMNLIFLSKDLVMISVN